MQEISGISTCLRRGEIATKRKKNKFTDSQKKAFIDDGLPFGKYRPPEPADDGSGPHASVFITKTGIYVTMHFATNLRNTILIKDRCFDVFLHGDVFRSFEYLT